MYKAITFLATFFLISLTSCGGDSSTPTNTETNPSQKSSHNAGQDCSNCHSEGGTASTMIFNSSGTVYKSNGSPQNNATVNLYTFGTNTRVATMKTDASGNFYTTDFVDGLFYGTGGVTSVDVEIQTSVGIRTMRGSVTSRSCNFCHGNTRSGISAN